ncbi:Integrase catalytic domain-containing protein [Paracidovorax anthurii]|uniref:Integrase catalytic domain-containing protein n=2 Tax=Paracidovorax anthurii TaxID=78229 RepID=A0A328ZRL5_9BURK|nr:hypothetical protein AX018_1005118 [Paracidovorax anthurii]
MAQQAGLSIATGLQVYFCDPHSLWQRGTSENTNGLLRSCLPRSMELSTHRAIDLLQELRLNDGGARLSGALPPEHRAGRERPRSKNFVSDMNFRRSLH